MELRLLKYFLEAANERSITRAAKRLHIPQPSLSKQLGILEH
ncbi:MAG: LysR family transcriptional regulator, partial [Synergistaceae bacterium]|nr:LysR family transcriptional regulator [Synergistaceae bacterium]